MPKKSKNWIPNFNRLVIIIERGRINLGKYTLPKIAEFATNVLEVL